MKDYVFLDTNIWIYCCLASEKNFDHSELVKIHKALDEGKFQLVLPETVESELFARLDEHLKGLRTELENAKREIKINTPTYKEKIVDAFDNQIKDAENNFQKSRKVIDKIFSHPNTVKLRLNSESLTSAFLRSVQNRRPYNRAKLLKESGEYLSPSITEVQKDAVIIEELIAYFKGKGEYKLLIGSYDKDYYDSQANSLHADIKHDLPNAELHRDLHSLMKAVKIRVTARSKDDEKIKEIASSNRTGLLDALLAANTAATLSPTITQIAKMQQDLVKLPPSTLSQLSEAAKAATIVQSLQIPNPSIPNTALRKLLNDAYFRQFHENLFSPDATSDQDQATKEPRDEPPAGQKR